MVEVIKFLKGFCMFIYLVIAILTLNAYFSSWRNFYNAYSEWGIEKGTADMRNKMGRLDPLDSDRLLYQTAISDLEKFNKNEKKENVILYQVGINGKCSYPIPTKHWKPCMIPKNMGFKGDVGVAFFLLAAHTIYLGNFVYLIIASISKIHDKALHILPIACLLATISLVIAMIIFAVCCDAAYVYKYKFIENGMGQVIGEDDTEYTDINFAHYIGFGGGFWLTLCSLLFSFLALLFSAAISFLAHKIPQNVGGELPKLGGFGGGGGNAPAANPVTVQAPPTQIDAAPAEAPPTPQVNVNVQATA